MQTDEQIRVTVMINQSFGNSSEEKRVVEERFRELFARHDIEATVRCIPGEEIADTTRAALKECVDGIVEIQANPRVIYCIQLERISEFKTFVFRGAQPATEFDPEYDESLKAEPVRFSSECPIYISAIIDLNFEFLNFCFSGLPI